MKHPEATVIHLYTSLVKVALAELELGVATDTTALELRWWTTHLADHEMLDPDEIWSSTLIVQKMLKQVDAGEVHYV